MFLRKLLLCSALLFLRLGLSGRGLKDLWLFCAVTSSGWGHLKTQELVAEKESWNKRGLRDEAEVNLLRPGWLKSG